MEEWRFQGWEDRTSWSVSSQEEIASPCLVYSQHLRHCLAHSMCSENVSWVNEASEKAFQANGMVWIQAHSLTSRDIGWICGLLRRRGKLGQKGQAWNVWICWIWFCRWHEALVTWRRPGSWTWAWVFQWWGRNVRVRPGRVRAGPVFLSRLKAAALVPERPGAIMRRPWRGKVMASWAGRDWRQCSLLQCPSQQDGEKRHCVLTAPESQGAHYGIGNKSALSLCLAAHFTQVPLLCLWLVPSVPVSFPWSFSPSMSSPSSPCLLSLIYGIVSLFSDCPSFLGK